MQQRGFASGHPPGYLPTGKPFNFSRANGIEWFRNNVLWSYVLVMQGKRNYFGRSGVGGRRQARDLNMRLDAQGTLYKLLSLVVCMDYNNFQATAR